MADESHSQEDRPGGHEQGDDAGDHLDDETAKDDGPGSPRIADGPAEEDQPCRTDGRQQHDRLELRILTDG